MALRLLGLALRQPAIIKGSQVGSVASIYVINKIGNREIVGYGINGSPNYVDKVDFPMPAIRFREETKQVTALREKEKCDWKDLTIDEKKTLYRHSFCQNYPEMLAFTGEWKFHVGIALLFSSAGLFLFMLTNMFIYSELPYSYSEQSQKAQLKRMLAMEMNPITGVSSKWCYVNKKWK